MSLPPRGEPATREVQAFILAGGRSRRMGRDKARLRIAGEPLVRVLARRFEPHVAAVWLVAKSDSGLEDLGLPLCYDDTPDGALVHGIQTVLRAPGPPWRFVLACDMPDIDLEVLDALVRAARQAGAPGACPRRPGSRAPEPLPSLWHAERAAASRPDWGLEARAWVGRAGLAAWDVPPGLEARFVNLNTPEDWSRWRRDGPAGEEPA